PPRFAGRTRCRYARYGTRPARVVGVDLDSADDMAGPAAHHDDPVREIDRSRISSPPAPRRDSGHSILPPLIGPSPAINRSKVDLPQPDGPIRLTNSPCATSRLTLFSAIVPFW